MGNHQDTTEVELVYHGYRQDPVGPVIFVETETGQRIGMLRHIVRHSPSGMNWGYRGSGPCDTALSLLLAVLGDDALCPVCRGTGQVVYIADGEGFQAQRFDPLRHGWAQQGWQCSCADGYRDVPYMQFADVVAGWDDEWTVSRSSILNWLRQAVAT